MLSLAVVGGILAVAALASWIFGRGSTSPPVPPG
jgi:hypothetical protein